MTDTAAPTLTDRAVTRLRAYAKGNGVGEDAIELVETTEALHTLGGVIKLVPDLNISSRASLGRLKGTGRKMLPSFESLKAEIENIREEFVKDGSWLDHALEELEKVEGHGWGQNGAHLTWGEKEIVLGASENCPTCNGTAQSTCTECRGIGHIPCPYCEGRGQEICPICEGRAIDTIDPTKPCRHCNGTRYAPCRYCHTTMKLTCPQCQGRGGTPCQACKGTGFISQEVHVTKGATVAFALGSTTELPSELLRMIQRIGEANIAKGHADIVMKPAPADAEGREDRTVVPMEAKIPFALVKLRLAGKPCRITVFGKQGRLSGVPLFLDEALTPARKALAQAASGAGPLETALKFRAIQSALDLALSSKAHPNDLRRFYPVGLSAQVAQEIMHNTGLVLRGDTARARLSVGVGAALASLGLFAGYHLTFLASLVGGTLGAGAARGIEILLPLLAIGGSWLALRHASRWALQHRYPKAKIALPPGIGHIGVGALSAIPALYLLILWLAGRLG